MSIFTKTVFFAKRKLLLQRTLRLLVVLEWIFPHCEVMWFFEMFFFYKKFLKCWQWSRRRMTMRTFSKSFCLLFPWVVNDFVISLSIVFTWLSAVIAIERDWWRGRLSSFFLFSFYERTKEEELMASILRLYVADGKVWHETINSSGQRVTLLTIEAEWEIVKSFLTVRFRSDINLSQTLRNQIE